MTNDSHEDLDGLLLDAVQEMKTSTADSELPADLNREVLCHLTSALHPNALRPANGSDDRIRSRSRIISFTKIISIIAAAALAIGFFSVRDGASDANSLFAQVASRFATVRSLTCRVQFIDDSRVEIADGEFGDKLTYLAPSQHRVDRLNGTVEISDTASDTILTLNHTAKESLTITGNIAKAVATASPAHLVELVRDHLSLERAGRDDIVELESRMIDGVQTTGFRSTMNGNVLEAWCDPDRQLPLLIRIRFTIPTVGAAETPDVKMWRVLTDFKYDVEVNSELFSLVTPDGYKSAHTESPVLDSSPSGLDDLIAVLKKCATVNELSFPQSLELNDNEGTTMAIMKRYASGFDEQFDNGTEAEKAEVMKQVTDFGALLGRSQAFLLSVTKANDLQYFGGAKLNDEDRPICWYSPDGNKNYKVVYADLSVRDVTRDALPEKPAVPKPPVGQRAAAAQKLKELGERLHAAQNNVVKVNTPTFKLPPQAIRKYADLQTIRQSGQQSQVEYLVLGWMPEFIDSQVPAVGPGEEIKPVEVKRGWVPDRSPDSERFEFLKEFPNLKGIDASHLYLTHRDLKAMTSCTKLQRLSLSGIQIHEASARRLIGADLQQLKGLTELEVLDLSQSNFSSGLKHLSDLPNLHTLYLNSFEHVNDASVAELKDLPHLKSLIMGPIYSTNPEKFVTESGLRSLQQLPSLKTLFVGYHGKWTLPVDKLRELLPNVNVVPPQ